MDQFLSNVSRASIIRWTAIYLVVYAVVNACGGIAFGILGGLTAGVSLMTSSMGNELGSTDAAAASTSLATLGGFSLVLGVLYLITVPLFAVVAWGLFQHRRWARMGAVIALGVSVLLSLLTLGNGFMNIIWIAISVVAIYLFWTDEGIRQELSR